MTKGAAIVLAGGSARRFQTRNQPWQDKALVEFEEKPLLVHVVQNLQPVVADIVVSVNDISRKEKYCQVLEKHGLRTKFVVDQKSCNIHGPVLAILSGLNEVDADHCLTVPVDMPFLKPQVANHILDAVESFDVAVPIWPDGTTETLLMAFQRKPGLEIAETLCTLSKSRADSIIRGASKLFLLSPSKEITGLDPELKSFININRKEDLTKLETRRTEGLLKDNIKLTRGLRLFSDLRLLREGQMMLNYGKISEAQTAFVACADSFEAQKFQFWAGVSSEKLAETSSKHSPAKSRNYMRAANNYQAEARSYEAKGCRLLAERALADGIRCESKVLA